MLEKDHESGKTHTRKPVAPRILADGVGRALRAAERTGCAAVMRMYGTPVYIWKNGKIVAEKP